MYQNKLNHVSRFTSPTITVLAALTVIVVSTLVGWEIGAHSIGPSNTVLMLVVGVFVLAISLINPFVGLLLMLLTASLDTYNPFVGGELTLNRGLAFLILGTMLLRNSVRDHKTPFVTTYFDVGLLGFVCVASLSSLFNGIGTRTMIQVNALVVGYLYYWFLINLISGWKHFKIVVIVLLVSSFFIAIALLLEAHSNPEALRAKIALGNDAGSMSAVGVVLLLWLMSSKLHPSLQLLTIALLGFLILAVLLSGTRAAVLGLVAAAAVIMATETSHRNRLKFALIAVALVFISIRFLETVAPNTLERVNSIQSSIEVFLGQNENEEEANIRTKINQKSVDAFSSNPIIGVGFGNVYSWGDFSQASHNVFLGALAETGLMGFAFFLSLYGYTAWWHIRIYRDPRASPATKRTSAYMLALFVCHPVIILLLHGSIINRQFMMIFGLIIAAARLSEMDLAEASNTVENHRMLSTKTQPR